MNYLFDKEILNMYQFKFFAFFSNEKNYPIVVFCISNSTEVEIFWRLSTAINIIPAFMPSDWPNPIIKKNASNINAKYIARIKKKELIIEPLLSYNDKLKKIFNRGIIHFSSSSTGKAKAVYRNEEQLNYEINRYINYLDISNNDVILSMTPLYHSYAFGSALLAALHTNATLVIPKINMPRNIINDCNQYKVTILHGTPYMYNKMLEYNEKYKLPNSMRFCIASGAPMIKGLQKSFYKAFGVFLLQQYGSTETGSLSISEKYDDFNCVGKPLKNIKFTTAYENKQSVVYVESQKTTGCYIENGIVNEICKKKFKIGDRGKIGKDEKLYLNGRIDKIVNIAGNKVNINHIESVIKKNFAIEYIKLEVVNNNLNNYIVASYKSDNIKSSYLANNCKQYLKSYEIPKYFRRDNKLPEKISWKYK